MSLDFRLGFSLLSPSGGGLGGLILGCHSAAGANRMSCGAIAILQNVKVGEASKLRRKLFIRVSSDACYFFYFLKFTIWE